MRAASTRQRRRARAGAPVLWRGYPSRALTARPPPPHRGAGGRLFWSHGLAQAPRARQVGSGGGAPALKGTHLGDLSPRLQMNAFPPDEAVDR